MYVKNTNSEEILLDDDDEDEYEVSDDEQELDYGELAQEKGELEEFLEEKIMLKNIEFINFCEIEERLKDVKNSS